MQLIKGVAGYKQLVRIAARCFYRDKIDNEDEKGVAVAKKKFDSTGLALIVLDALTRREWTEEEKLAEALKVNPKLLRKTVRELERQQILKREHKKFKDREKAEDETQAAGEKKPLRAQTQSLCCIDYPRFMEILQLRIFLMRKKIKDELADSEPVMHYKCKGCNKSYTSMDMIRLVDYEGGSAKLRCEDCHQGIEQSLGTSGETGDDQQRRQRKQSLKQLQKRMEEQLKPLMEQMKAVQGVDPPDYGCHQDWSRERIYQKLAAEGKAAAPQPKHVGHGSSGATRISAPIWSNRTDVQVEVGAAPEAKETPAWMLSGEAQATSAEAAQQEEKNDNAASSDLDQIQQAYLRQYMSAVERHKNEFGTARASAPREEPDLKRAKTGADSPVVKGEGVWNEIKQDSPKWEGGRSLPDGSPVEWEDASVPLGHTSLQGDAPGGNGGQEEEDDFEWEDAS
uniref:Transcription initiation factor TFIIE subunit alpha n=1 Tax=Tetraselmis sp. GSL018 TaxID=582737 RepID=A0A061QQU5_9CHLO